MNTELLTALQSKYIEHCKDASKFFNMWIEQGEDVYKEKELMNYGAACATLTIIKMLETL